MCSFYGWTYRAVMEMPIRTFWAANATIGRITAERELRQAQLLASIEGGGEALTGLIEALKEEHGKPAVAIDHRRDVDAVDKLRKALS